MNEFIVLWLFAITMIDISLKLEADAMSIKTPMFFFTNQWITKKEVSLFSIMMVITTIITGFFLIQWYYDLIISFLFLSIGRFLFGIINHFNLLTLFFLSLIGFTITMFIVIF